MELKDYQQQALGTLDRYLDALKEARQQIEELVTSVFLSQRLVHLQNSHNQILRSFNLLLKRLLKNLKNRLRNTLISKLMPLMQELMLLIRKLIRELIPLIRELIPLKNLLVVTST